MEITLEKQSTTNATIKINLTQDDYKPRVAEKLKEYSKKASIKGFRPGKVPPALIQKMYGKGILVDEINNLLSKSVIDYIKENNLPVVGDPLPDTENVDKADWENPKDFEFYYKVGLVPEFKYDLEGLKVTKYTVKAGEKDVEEVIKNLQEQYGTVTHPETSAEGDALYGTLKEVNGELTNDTLLSLSKVQKGELKKFVGVKKDDKVTFDIKKAFAETAEIAHLTGLSTEEAESKSGEFEFTVQNIDRPEPANLDQELFDKLFGKDNVKSEEEFRNKIQDTISENYNKEAEFLVKRDIQEKLIENTAIELPREFLKTWLLQTNQGKITQEQIDKEFHFYEKELKWTLIKNNIGKDHEVKVEHADVLKQTKDMFIQQFGNMPLGDEMDETLNKIAENYLQQENGKNYMKIFDQAYNDKISNFIKEKAKIEEKEVDTEGFKKAAGF